MNVEVLVRHFGRMGARAEFGEGGSTVRVDVLRDKRGEFFEIVANNKAVELDVLDVRPKDRHLLLMAKFANGGRKDKFLCGHDERAWFVAAVPNDRGVANVPTAIEALKPSMVRQRQSQLRVKTVELASRKNLAYIRQGEWFFVPTPDLRLDERWMLRNEPIRRDFRSKPHMCEYLIREGGETVYVNPRNGNVLTQKQYANLVRGKPEVASQGWNVMKRNPSVYVKGRVSHRDHKSIVLPFWHRVVMNTEFQAPAMRHISFLD
jgi:hypothetical protein